MADPKKLAVYKTEATIKKKIKEYVANSGIFKKEELDDVKYNMKDFLEEWKKQQAAIVHKVEKIRRYVQAKWTLGALHGIRHWDRVYENGQKLLTPDTNPLVIGLFAYLHDSCRIDDGEDLYHGKRAADWIETLRGTYLKDVSNEEIELLRRVVFIQQNSKQAIQQLMPALILIGLTYGELVSYQILQDLQQKRGRKLQETRTISR